MFEKIREKLGVSETVQPQEVEVSDKAIALAKNVVYLAKEPVPGPNPQLESAIVELADELGVTELDSKTVQAKAYEIERQAE